MRSEVWSFTNDAAVPAQFNPFAFGAATLLPSAAASSSPASSFFTRFVATVAMMLLAVDVVAAHQNRASFA
jgi:hypothetical protein